MNKHQIQYIISVTIVTLLFFSFMYTIFDTSNKRKIAAKKDFNLKNPTCTHYGRCECYEKVCKDYSCTYENDIVFNLK